MTNLLSSREAIERLIWLYADALDAGRLDDLSFLFARGCIKVDGRSDAVHGSAAVKKMFSTFTCFYNNKGERVDIRKEQGKPFTRHIISNLHFESLTSIHARVHSCFTVVQCLPGKNMDAIISGRYADTFAFDDQGWHFVERYEYIDLIGDVSHHLRVNPFL